jgi:hypothetical protein
MRQARKCGLGKVILFSRKLKAGPAGTVMVLLSIVMSTEDGWE